MTTQGPTRTFAEVSAVTRTSPGHYSADIDQWWSFAGFPNGGYLQPTMARATLDTAGCDHVLSASAHYLAAPGQGPAEIATEILRAGKSTTQVRSTLSQDGESKVEALFLLGTLPDPEDSRIWTSERLQPAGLAHEDSARYVPDLGHTPVPLMHQIDLRLEPESQGFYQGRPRGEGELRGWLDLPGDEGFDPVSLLFAVDTFPPGTFDIAVTGWVPTFTMATYVRAVPAPGPVQIVLEATLVQGGRVDETCTVRDSEGTVVAQAHQLAGVRLP